MPTTVHASKIEHGLNTEKLDLQSFLERIPKLSHAAMQAMTMINNKSMEIRQLVNVLETEPALVISVLKIANSPFYGLKGEINNLCEACMILGQHTLHNIITAASVLGILHNCTSTIRPVELLKHSLHTAAVARQLALACDEDSDFAYLVGLLHDIGSLLIHVLLTEEYQQIQQYKIENECTILDAERAVLGIDHAELSSKIALYWNLSNKMSQVISSHHEPNKQPSPMTDVIYIADIISVWMNTDASLEALQQKLTGDACDRLNLPALDMQAFVDKCPPMDEETIMAILSG